MLPAEAIEIKRALTETEIDLSGITHVLNIGSQGQHFREVIQPWLGGLLSWLTAEKGMTLLNCDISPGPGVDLVLDVMSEHLAGVLASFPSSIVMISNLLEHVSDPLKALDNLANSAQEGQILLISGPSSFPFHPDPIDNLFRPSASDIISLIASSYLIYSARDVTERFYFWHFFNKRGRRLAGILNLCGALGRAILHLDKNYLYGWVLSAKAFVVLAQKTT